MKTLLVNNLRHLASTHKELSRKAFAGAERKLARLKAKSHRKYATVIRINECI